MLHAPRIRVDGEVRLDRCFASRRKVFAVTKTPTQSIESYFKPYAVPYYVTHAANIVKWLDDDGWDIVRRDGGEGTGLKTFDPRDAGFTLQSCGCRENECEGRTDGTCHHPTLEAAPPKPAPDAMREALVRQIAQAMSDGKDSGEYETLLDMYAHTAITVIEQNASPPIRGNQQTFYTILSKYFPKDATFDNLWQELKEAGCVR